MRKEQEGSAWLVDLLMQLLRPLVRIVIKAVNYHQFTELLKVVYVEEAKALIEREGRSRVTKSEISMITGLDSRQYPFVYDCLGTVKNRMRTSKIKLDTFVKVSPEVYLLAFWATDTAFVDDNGYPRDLPIRSSTGSFEQLVTKYYPRGVTTQTVIKKLVDSGNVEQIGEGRVRFLNQIFIPITDNKNELIKWGLDAVVNLFNTIEHNLNTEQSENRFFQRQIWSIQVPLDSMFNIQMKLTEFLKKQIAESRDFIDNHDKGRLTEYDSKIGVGYYFFADGFD